jgi:hypothetical protein
MELINYISLFCKLGTGSHQAQPVSGWNALRFPDRFKVAPNPGLCERR